MKTILMKVTVAYLVRLAQEDESWHEVIRAYQEMAIEEKPTYFIPK